MDSNCKWMLNIINIVHSVYCSCLLSQALDPIDGTKGFLRNDQYAVALALIEDGKPVLGVLGCPNIPHDLSDPTSLRGTFDCVYRMISYVL